MATSSTPPPSSDRARAARATAQRVVVVTTSYPAGAEDPSGHFVEAEVEALRDEGDEVTVLRPDPGGAFGWPGAAVRLKQKPLRMFEVGTWASLAIARLRAARPERVIAHWSLPSAWPVALVGLAGLPEVSLEVVSHGGDVRLLAGMPEALRARAVLGIAARATRWRFVSESLLGDLEATCDEPSRQALRRVAVVAPSVVTMPDVRVAIAARRRSLHGRRLYVCAGRLVVTKRFDKVIDYVASAEGDRRHDRVLVVVGDGPERARLERMADRWGMDARFVGCRPRRDTLAWLGAADEIVHASTAEGLSTVIREAEHLGVPVTFLR